MDDTLIAEMCAYLHCGFPLYSQVEDAYPHLLRNITHELRTRTKNKNLMPYYRKLRTYDFSQHLNNVSIITEDVVYSDGYYQISGWYKGHPYAEWCVAQLSGCKIGDPSCEDRHAYQQLVRGPFHPPVEKDFSPYLKGTPPHIQRAIFRLPHAMAPRLDIGVHLRCQFKQFEKLVVPLGQQWALHQEEVSNFLQSDEHNAGQKLFHAIALKIKDEISFILDRKEVQRALHPRQVSNLTYPFQHRRLRTKSGWKPSKPATDQFSTSRATHTSLSSAEEIGDEEVDRVMIYVAADNEEVKEALVSYLKRFLESHPSSNFTQVASTQSNTVHLTSSSNNSNRKRKVQISLLRIQFPHQHISHAKDLAHIRNATAGVFTLLMDWYALSLANRVVSWRRDSFLPSTYALSARRFSGHSLLYYNTYSYAQFQQMMAHRHHKIPGNQSSNTDDDSEESSPTSHPIDVHLVRQPADIEQLRSEAKTLVELKAQIGQSQDEDGNAPNDSEEVMRYLQEKVGGRYSGTGLQVFSTNDIRQATNHTVKLLKWKVF